MKKIFILAIFVILTSCSLPGMLIPPEKEISAPLVFKNHKAYVFFYREPEFVGSGRGMYILLDGKKIGGMNMGTFFIYESDPGEFIFVAENSAQKEFEPKRRIKLEAGKKYYMRGTVRMGGWDALPFLEIMNEMEGPAAVEFLQYAIFE